MWISSCRNEVKKVAGGCNSVAIKWLIVGGWDGSMDWVVDKRFIKSQMCDY